MKSKKLPFFLLAVALMLSQFSFGQWQHVGGPAFTGTNVDLTRIAIGKNDTPYVAFRDNGVAGGKMTVMKYANGSWTDVGNPGFSPNAVWETSLAIDSATGTPYVAYIDSAAGLTVAKYNGTSWAFVGAPGFPTNNQVDQIQVVIGGDGTPYVSFRDGNASYKTNVMKYDGSSWVQVGNGNFSADNVDYCRMAVDHNGVVYMASVLDQGIQVQRFNGSAWLTLGTLGFDTAYTGITYGPDLAFRIGTNNQPYVAFTYYQDTYDAEVWTYNGTAWSRVGQPVTNYDAEGIDLAISRTGKLFISYANYSGHKASVSTYNGTNWIQVGSSDFSTAATQELTIAANSINDVYVAYIDDGNGYSITVDEYLHNVGIHETAGLSEFKLYPNPNTGRFQISFVQVQSGEVELSVTDIMGRTILHDIRTSSNGNESIDLPGVSKGLYAIQVKTNNGVENRLVEIK